MNIKISLAALVAATLVAASSSAQTPQSSDSVTLRAVSSFTNIGNERERSIALFREAGKVIASPRCMNCHPASDRPTQTDRMRPHEPWVIRGADDKGAPGMPCTTCHHAANFDPARVPGHPEWHVAPLAMAWQGRSLGQICEHAVELDPAAVAFVTPDQFKWRDPTDRATTNRTTLLGDPNKPALYIYINKFKPDRFGNPHYHPNDRFITVIDGAPWRGTGPVVDPAQPRGSRRGRS